MEKYIYFRTVTSFGADDSAADSVAFPVSNFVGILPKNTSDGTAANTLTLSFKSIKNMKGAGQNSEVILTDNVNLTITPGKSLQVIKAIMGAIHGHSTSGGFVTIADDVLGTTIDPGITACGIINVLAALS